MPSAARNLPACHPERSEGSPLAGPRFLAPLGMTTSSLSRTDASARQTCVLRRERADGGPVERLAAVREQREEAVAQQAGDRERDAQVIGGGEREADVLLAEGRSKACGLELPSGDQRAVRLVDGRAEQRRCQHIEISMWIDATLDDERHRFAERFDDGADEKVAA